MGRFRNQLLPKDNTWSTSYNILKNDRYSDTSTDWNLLKLKFSEEILGIKSIFDPLGTAHAVMSFSNITIPRSIY